MSGKMKGAVIGYGGAFNMGRLHGRQMLDNGIEFAAACDLSPERVKQAEEDYPGIRTYTDVKELLAQDDIGLVTIITPHNSHATLAMQVLESGKHCIIEKPMCIYAEDADALIRKSKEKKLMLSVFHNRRWDGWYTAFLANRHRLGEIYKVEMFFGGYKVPKDWWRSDKAVSGGQFYDWGAHYIDWLLGFMEGKIVSVRGFAQKKVFHQVTNEDQIESIIAFDTGAVAHVEVSSIAYASKPLRRISGAKGVIVDDGSGVMILHTLDGEGQVVEEPIEYNKGGSEWVRYYANIADHLYNGAELLVKPEQARRVIAVLDYTGKSAEAGRELALPFE